MKRRRAVTGDEADVFSRRWRRWVRWGRGETKAVKRGANRRERREGKADIREELE